jgi:polysaccharide deacetylase family protein (PEP-CTERM system associated)
VAEAFPGLVRRVAEAGHEIGVHGFHHHRPDMLPPETFRESIIRAKEAVEQAGGAAVMGYRAVAFGINLGTRWVLDVLSEAGFKYDASVFPMRLPRYGYKEAPTEPHWVQTTGGGWIYEIPITVCRFPGFRLPFAGGGYFRLFPYWLTSLLMKWESRRRQVVFYFHPYEIEAENGLGSLPEVLNNNEINIIRRRFILENRGRATVLKKMRRLLGSYCFTSISQAFRVAGLAPKHR